jgi:hypothetical protein
MPYTPAKRPITPTPEELRARIPGWGVDLDPADRPSVPRERFHPGATGAHWEFPDRQPELRPRERSIEHMILPPVFGTSCPTKGISGALRRYAYRRYSEARAAHWLLLIAADRVDVVEHRIRGVATGRPDPVVPTGLRSELTRGGVRSRRGRVDARHHLLDPLVAGAPWLILGGIALAVVRAVRR